MAEEDFWVWKEIGLKVEISTDRKQTLRLSSKNCKSYSKVDSMLTLRVVEAQSNDWDGKLNFARRCCL